MKLYNVKIEFINSTPTAYLISKTNWKMYKEHLQLLQNKSLADISKINAPWSNIYNNALSIVKTYRDIIKHNAYTLKKYTITLNSKNHPLDNKVYTQTFPLNYNKKDIIKWIKDTQAGWLATIKLRKSKAKQNRLMSKTFYYGENDRTFRYDMVAYVHTQSGIFLKFKELKESAEIFNSKKPKDDSKYLGLELEFYCEKDQQQLSKMFFAAGLAKDVQLKTDGSIRPENEKLYPHELNILMKETEYESIVQKVCTVLREAKSQVNSSCGMHVHIDMRNRQKDLAFNNLVASQHILFAMNPKSRATSRYCKKNMDKKFPENPRDRYLGINPDAYSKYKTLEVRMHTGTVNKTKIMNWLKLIMYIINHEELIKRAPTTFRGFVKRFNIDMDLAEYIAGRIERFNSADNDDEKLEEANAA